MVERDLYPGYDVTRKRNTLSWNDATRRLIDARLTVRDQPEFFSHEEWRILNAVCDRIMPQPAHRARVPIAAYIDRDLNAGVTPGFRNIALPSPKQAWPNGLTAIAAEAVTRHGQNFTALLTSQQDALLKAVEQGDVTAKQWESLDPKLFFSTHVMTDIISAYYAHPIAWSEIGYGGPASPRGYVRMHADERDPWEAIRAEDDTTEEVKARNANVR